MDAAYGLPVEVLPEPPSQRSGAVKRRRKQALPRTFLVVDMERARVVGAFVLSECAHDTEADALVWRCDLGVALTAPVQVRREELSVGRRLKLTAWTSEREAEVRQSSAVPGGSLNDHFLHHVGERWHGWPAEGELSREFAAAGSAPFSFWTRPAYSAAVGISPTEML